MMCSLCLVAQTRPVCVRVCCNDVGFAVLCCLLLSASLVGVGTHTVLAPE